MPFAFMVFSIGITVCVQGEAAPPLEWSRAAPVAAHIFESAGVSIEWRREGACAAPAICIALSTRALETLHSDGLGYTVFPGDASRAYAAIYLPGVAATARQLEVDPAVVLGAALAHEAGHLLLGSRGHTSGIMGPQLDWRALRAASRGELLFRRDDARQIRRAIGGISGITGCTSIP